MSNRKLVVPTEHVQLPGADEPLVVRGLSVNDFKTLINLHRDIAATVFDKIVNLSNAETAQGTSIDDMVTMVIDEFPLVLADFIAISAGQLDNADAFVDLPVVAQFDAVVKICRLTFGEEDAAKKLFATVAKVMASANQKMAAVANSA